MHRGQHRVGYLDGLRGVAIALVIGFHLFGNESREILPHGDELRTYPIAAYGWMGVPLFFLISGFVIFMTLERCSGWIDFMLRRWVRLFPAMFAVSLLLFALAGPAPLPGAGLRLRAVDLLPGLSFLSDSFWHAVLRTPVRSADPLFWTLYVEAAFYMVFGVLYLRFGWRWAVAGLYLLAAATRLLELTAAVLPSIPILTKAVSPLTWFGIHHFAWFASGALFYRAGKDNRSAYAWIALLGALVAALVYYQPMAMAFSNRVLLCTVPVFFAVVQQSSALQRLLACKPILFLGQISYPLYLVHYNLSIVLTNAMANVSPAASATLWRGVAIGTSLLIATAMARHIEPALAKLAVALTNRLRAGLGIQRS